MAVSAQTGSGRLRLLAVGAAWLVWLTACVPAVGTVAPRPIATPAAFDAAAVQTLLDRIERPREAMILKVVYFQRHSPRSLPAVDGFALLENAIAGAPPGSRRWFLLQNVRGYAAFRAPDVPVGNGLDAYRLIFARAADAAGGGAGYVLGESVTEFVAAVGGRLSTLDRASGADVKALLPQAWDAFFRRVPEGERSRFDVPWGLAAEATKANVELAQIVDRTIADAGVPKTYPLLKAAAEVYEPVSPSRAAALWRQAIAMAPAGDDYERDWLYARLVAILSAGKTGDPGAVSEAITLTQERIKTSGRGAADLGILYLTRGDRPGFAAVIAGLEQPNARESEINALAERLLDLTAPQTVSGMAQGCKASARALLVAYLVADRKRTPGEDVRARIALARSLLNEGDRAGAEGVLRPALEAAATAPAGARPYYRQAQRMADAAGLGTGSKKSEGGPHGH